MIGRMVMSIADLGRYLQLIISLYDSADHYSGNDYFIVLFQDDGKPEKISFGQATGKPAAKIESPVATDKGR